MVSKSELEMHRKEYEDASRKVHEKINDSKQKFREALNVEEYSVVERYLTSWITSLIQDAKNEKKHYEIERDALPFLQKLFKSKKSSVSVKKDIEQLSMLEKLINLKNIYKHSDDVILLFEQISVLSSALSDETYHKILRLKQIYTKKRYGEEGLFLQLERTLKNLEGQFHPDDAKVASFLKKGFSNIEPDTTKFEENLKQKKSSDFVFLASKLYHERGSKLQSTTHLEKFNNLCEKYDKLLEGIFSIRIIIEKMNKISRLSENDSYLVSVQSQIDAIITDLTHYLSGLEKEQISVASELDTFLEQHLKSEGNTSVVENIKGNKRSDAQKQNDKSPDSYRYQPGILKSESAEEYIERLRQINPENVPDYQEKLHQKEIDKILHNLSLKIHEYVNASPEFSHLSSVEKGEQERELYSDLAKCAIIDYILQNKAVLSDVNSHKRS